MGGYIGIMEKKRKLLVNTICSMAFYKDKSRHDAISFRGLRMRFRAAGGFTIKLTWNAHKIPCDEYHPVLKLTLHRVWGLGFGV